VTNPLTRDTDKDGLDDGFEDLNRNGTIDDAEFDPNVMDTYINCGGKYTLAHIVDMLKALSGHNEMPADVSDLNGDDRIGLEEVLYLLQKIACLRR